MKKEQIELMNKLQKAIDNREIIYYKLSTMLKDAKNNDYSCRAHDLILMDSIKLSDASNKEEFVEQLEFLVAYHKVKLEEQIKEMDNWILAKKAD